MATTDKELTQILAKLRDEYGDLEMMFHEKEKDSQEIENDLKKLKDSLRTVDSALNENLVKLSRAEENYKEVMLFYDKLLENTKNLNNFITRQNAILEN